MSTTWRLPVDAACNMVTLGDLAGEPMLIAVMALQFRFTNMWEEVGENAQTPIIHKRSHTIGLVYAGASQRC